MVDQRKFDEAIAKLRHNVDRLCQIERAAKRLALYPPERRTRESSRRAYVLWSDLEELREALGISLDPTDKARP